ncbi:MAG: GTPase Era [Dethiobacteria bacterium]|jgi:GTP-binding protein Era
MFVSGFVAVVGRPNVGKSTLINSLLGDKILIVSDKPQTTRNRIHAILTTDDAQVIFIDTPGIHKPRHKLGDYMVRAASEAMKEVDLIIFVVEATASPGKGDKYIAGFLSGLETPVFLVINKMDLAPANFRGEWLPLYLNLATFKETFLVTALTGDNLGQLLAATIKFLPEGPLYFPPDMLIDRPEQFFVGEKIREKILHKTREEIPHSVAVEITKMQTRENADLIDIEATIYVERQSQKGIIIGRGGTLLKEVGTEVRLELEKLFGNPIYLDLWVKVKKDWRQKENILRQLGYE